MKNKILALTIIALITFSIFACEEDNIVEDNIITTPIINIGQTSSNTLAIAITASNSEAANQRTDIFFTKNTVLVSYSVTAYGGGEANITICRFTATSMQCKVIDLNNNQSVGQEPLNFKPTSVIVNIKSGYTGVVAMALIGK